MTRRLHVSNVNTDHIFGFRGREIMIQEKIFGAAILLQGLQMGKGSMCCEIYVIAIVGELRSV